MLRTVTAAYPGASPETVNSTVAGPLEQQMTGLQGLLYQGSQSTPDGTMQLVGMVDADEVSAWQLVLASGGGDVTAIASFAEDLSIDLHARLVALARRRLVIQTAAGFHPLRHH